MNSEYCIKILLTAHEHDNHGKPYHWCILGYETEWHQIACGWEETPDHCFTAAKEAYSLISS